MRPVFSPLRCTAAWRRPCRGSGHAALGSIAFGAMSEAVRRRARAAVEERKERPIEPSPPTKSPEGCGTAATDTSARSCTSRPAAAASASSRACSDRIEWSSINFNLEIDFFQQFQKCLHFSRSLCTCKQNIDRVLFSFCRNFAKSRQKYVKIH